MKPEERQAPFLFFAVGERRPLSTSIPDMSFESLESIIHHQVYLAIDCYNYFIQAHRWRPGTPVAPGCTRSHLGAPWCSVVFRPSPSLTGCQFKKAEGILVVYLHPLGFRPLGVGPGGSLRQCILFGSGYNVIAFRILILYHNPYSQFSHTVFSFCKLVPVYQNRRQWQEKMNSWPEIMLLPMLASRAIMRWPWWVSARGEWRKKLNSLHVHPGVSPSNLWTPLYRKKAKWQTFLIVDHFGQD